MGKSHLQMILDVLARAVVKETLSFNYYFKAGKDTSLPDGVRGLLSQLAEEERAHRKLLLNEYTETQRGWGGKSPDGEDTGSISFSIPDNPHFVPLQAAEDIDFSAVSLPARLIGGDNILARVIRKRPNDYIGMFFTLYDVMGHSLETTRINSRAASILGEYLDNFLSTDAEKEILSPARVVRHLNGEFSREYEGQGVFLTLFAAFIDLTGNSICYTTAGHEPPMIVRDNGQVDSLFNTQLVIGIDPHLKYSERTIPFDRGDTLCFFSDGILDAKNPAEDFSDGKGCPMFCPSLEDDPPKRSCLAFSRVFGNSVPGNRLRMN